MTVETIAVGLEVPRPGRVLRFRDQASGYSFSVTTPDESPQLWEEYVRGALDVYQHYGIERALEYDTIAEGRSTPLFFAASNAAGEIVGGVRMQGPYTWLAEVGSLAPWAGRSGESDLNTMFARRIPSGVVEARTAWVARDAPARAELSAAVSRCIAHGPRLLGARYVFATVASFTASRHRASGGIVADAIPPVPYPDQRYDTVPIWWDTRTYRMFADKLQYLLMCGELRAMGIADNPAERARRLSGHRSEGRRRHGR